VDDSRSLDIEFGQSGGAPCAAAQEKMREKRMIDLPPAAQIQLAQAEAQPEPPAEPTPIKVDVSQYVPDYATSVTMIVTVEPPTGSAFIYIPGYENYGTLFKGPRDMGEVRLVGPIVYVKLYGGATKFNIQYTNYRQP
jgi:hypothetical protein